jgi:hypothetical protein
MRAQFRPGQLFEQPVLTNDLLGAPIILQQLIDQRLVDGHESFCSSHGRLHRPFYSSAELVHLHQDAAAASARVHASRRQRDRGVNSTDTKSSFAHTG